MFSKAGKTGKKRQEDGGMGDYQIIQKRGGNMGEMEQENSCK